MRCPLCSVPGTVWGTLNKSLNSHKNPERSFYSPYFTEEESESQCVQSLAKTHPVFSYQVIKPVFNLGLSDYKNCLFCNTVSLEESYLVLVHIGVNQVDSKCAWLWLQNFCVLAWTLGC